MQDNSVFEYRNDESVAHCDALRELDGRSNKNIDREAHVQREANARSRVIPWTAVRHDDQKVDIGVRIRSAASVRAEENYLPRLEPLNDRAYDCDDVACLDHH